MKQTKAISKQEAATIAKKMAKKKKLIHKAIEKGESSESLKQKGIRLATPI